MTDPQRPTRGPLGRVFLFGVWVLLGYGFLMVVVSGVQLITTSRVALGVLLAAIGGVSLVVTLRVAISTLRGQGFLATGELTRWEFDYYAWLGLAPVILGVVILLFIVVGLGD